MGEKRECAQKLLGRDFKDTDSVEDSGVDERTIL